MALLDRNRKLEIYGPVGVKSFLECTRETVQFVLTFPIELFEIKTAGIICDEKEYTVQAAWANHVIPSFAYVFTEKTRPGHLYPAKLKKLGVPEGPLWSRLQDGQEVIVPHGRVVKPEEVLGKPRLGRKIVYTGDARSVKNLVRFGANADLLIYDSTLDDSLADKAEEDGHSTPSQAARAARKMGAKLLVLTHISARYPENDLLLKQAQRIFKNTIVAEDFMKIEIPFPED
jgi:ribonuclease Z